MSRPSTWSRFWWEVTHLFSSPDDIAAEEKRRIAGLVSQLDYEITTKSNTSRWTYAKAGTQLAHGDEEGARELLATYAQELLVLRRIRDHKNRLEMHSASLTGLNIQFHMLNSYEHLTWATEKWARGEDLDTRLEALETMAENLEDMHTVMQEGDATLEHHNTQVEQVRPKVEETLNLNTTVNDMLAKLKEEHKDRLVREAPSVSSNRRPPPRKKVAALRI
jgi:hypothetical protein